MTLKFIEMILKFDLETKIRKGEKLKCLFDTTSSFWSLEMSTHVFDQINMHYLLF